MGLRKREPASTATPRKKSCQPCANAKVRCDQRRPCCTRCEKRDTRDECGYEGDSLGLQEEASPLSNLAVQDVATDEDRTMDDLYGVESAAPKQAYSREMSSMTHTSLSPGLNISSTRNDILLTPRSTSSVAHSRPATAWTDLDLVCTIDPNEIGTRWLKRYVPDANQAYKAYPDRIIIFISNILKAYVSGATLTSVLPPFVHHCQQSPAAIPPPLAACLSLTRLCNRPLPAGQTVVLEALNREMGRLYAEHDGYEEAELVAAFQAYLIYALLIYFHFDDGGENALHRTMVNLQDIACKIAKGGLVSACELQRSRPTWESWIVAEAKRRTMYTMCLFDSILCARDDLPNFLSTELQTIPAPNGKLLWQATNRKTWNLAYNEHLHLWGDENQLQIEELWPRPATMTEEEVNTRQERVARWALSLDEFGTMLYAVTTVTHGA